MPVDTRWFRDRLADRRMSQRGLARALGLDAAAVSLMFRGKRRMQMSEAADVARLLGVPIDEVIAHAGIRAPASGGLEMPERDLPLMYWIDGHGEMHPIPPGERVEMRAALPDDAVVAQCRTAMSPLEHMDRWLLAFSAPTKAGVPADAVGRYCVMRLAGGVMMAGYLRPGYKAGTFAVHSATVIMDARLDWAAPVLLIQP